LKPQKCIRRPTVSATAISAGNALFPLSGGAVVGAGTSVEGFKTL
jgi:hypothetical protein